MPIEPSCRLFAQPWFMTVFGRMFPDSLTLRVWDAFLLDGWLVVHRVGLALLHLARARSLSPPPSLEFSFRM